MKILYYKIKPYLPYIISLIALLVFIILLIYHFTSTEETTPETTPETTQETTQGRTTRRSNRNTAKKFVGNKSLDKIYTDAGGNNVLSNARLISKIDLDTDKYSCSYLVTYKGNNDRNVECISGCSDETDATPEEKFCNKYRYNDGDVIGSLDDTFLDQTFISRRRAKGRRREGD